MNGWKLTHSIGSACCDDSNSLPHAIGDCGAPDSLAVRYIVPLRLTFHKFDCAALLAVPGPLRAVLLINFLQVWAPRYGSRMWCNLHVDSMPCVHTFDGFGTSSKYRGRCLQACLSRGCVDSSTGAARARKIAAARRTVAHAPR